MENNNLDYLINFINNNLDNLLKIYIQERTNKGDGILFIKGDKQNNNVSVGFNILSNLDKILTNKINDLNYTKTKAYFFAFDVNINEQNFLIEKELILS